MYISFTLETVALPNILSRKAIVHVFGKPPFNENIFITTNL